MAAVKPAYLTCYMNNIFPSPLSVYAIEEGNILMPRFDLYDILPCITQDANTSEVLMLGYMNPVAFRRTIETGYAHYYSRARKKIWKKGEQSGQTQLVKEIRIDDDQDCILIKVTLTNGASCHVGYRSCFFRQLNWKNKTTNFSLSYLETQKVYNPEDVYNEAEEPEA
jgi:phosphoribosyl-AMP cyclohydrolase